MAALTSGWLFIVFNLVTMIHPPIENHPPKPGDTLITVWLKDSIGPDKEEFWFSQRLLTEPSGLITTAYADNEVRNIPIVAKRNEYERLRLMGQSDVPVDPPFPERIYYGYLCPELQQHSWNVETDEPNAVIRCIGQECKIIEAKERYLRDANNKIIPGNAPAPPPNSPPPLSDQIGIAAIFALMAAGVGFTAWWFRELLRPPRP